MMDGFAERRRVELYGSGRRRAGEEVRSLLTESHILRDGEFNISKNSNTPGFQWSTVTLDDYKRGINAADQGRQYDQGYKSATGSVIPIKHKDIPADTYKLTTSKDDYTYKGLQEKTRLANILSLESFSPYMRMPILRPRGYIGNDPTTNWPDMTPSLIKGKKLGLSEYKELYITEDMKYKQPDYPKIKTTKTALPLPFDERKHKINVSLGSEVGGAGLFTESSSRYLQTYPKKFDPENIQRMKGEMEWNSNVFKSGDYNSTGDGVQQSQFDVDFGKRPRGATQTQLPDQSLSREDAETLLDTTIDNRLHFMPQLIESSMRSDNSKQDGEDGKKYHTKAHFNLGSHADQSMSVYYKDYLPYKSQLKPERIRQSDAGVLNSSITYPHKTSNSVDYAGTSRTGEITSTNKAIREYNMTKQNVPHINFTNDTDGEATSLASVFTRDFRGPPRYYKQPSAAKERKCEFNFLESGGATNTHTTTLIDKTENKENFTGAAGASKATMFYDKERVKSAAKRRVKSGRRAHFILGSQGSNYNTVSADTFTGKQRDDQNVPAAGKVEKQEKNFAHFPVSENTQDYLAHPIIPSNQESRTALDNYSQRKTVLESTNLKNSTVTRSDYLPISDRAYTVPQLKQIEAESIKGSKKTARTHFFHTDSGCGNNYETTAMASFIKPELMSGKVHLSSLQ